MKEEDSRKRQRSVDQDDGGHDEEYSEAPGDRDDEPITSPHSQSKRSRSSGSAGSPLARASSAGTGTASSARASPGSASVLETTATPPHYEPPTALLLDLNQRLLTSIAECDYDTYNQLCSDDMSCMEPESHHQVVVGKAFHKYYFDLYGKSSGIKGDAADADVEGGDITTNKVTMSQPHIQWLGGTPRRHPMVAVLSYVKLTQTIKGEEKRSVTIPQSETRVWELRNNKWKCVHFHKSSPLAG
jgi:Calcium/calmodulin dependent protein kinase II association domain